MKKTLLIALIFSALAAAQRTDYGDRNLIGNLVIGGQRTGISGGTTLPATCSTKDIFFKTDGSAGAKVYGCESANTWVVQGSVGGGVWGSITGTLSSQTDLSTALGLKTAWTQNTSDPPGTCPGSGAAISFHSNTSQDTYWGCNGTNTPSQIITDGFAWVNPAWITSLPFTKITGVATKAQQHAATVYTDQINAFGAGLLQSFTHNGTASGFRWAPVAGNPSSFQSGDAWYNLTDNRPRVVLNSTIVRFAIQEPSGTPATNDCARFNSSGYLESAGAACGSGGGISGLTTNTIPRAASSTTIADSNILQVASGAITLAKNLSFPAATAITASATPTWDLSLNNTYTFAPTANVTSWTISNAPAGAATIVLVITNDSTPRTVAAPTGFVGFDGPDANASSVYVQIYDKVGSTYYGRPGRCVATCSSGFDTKSGKTSGSATRGVADIAGTPNRINEPIATGNNLGVMQTDGANPQQASWQDSTGIGNIVRATSATLVTPALGTPSAAVLTNATGLPAAGIASGTIATARLGSGTANGTTYLRGDQTWATVSGGAVWKENRPVAIRTSGSGVTPLVNANGSFSVSASIPTGLHTVSLNNAGTESAAWSFYLDDRFTAAGVITASVFAISDSSATYNLIADTACVGTGEGTPGTFNSSANASQAMLGGSTLVKITIPAIPTTNCAAGEYMEVRLTRGTDTPGDIIYVTGIALTQ